LEARLNRIVTTGDKLHTQVFERSNNQQFDIIEGLGLMLKVSLKDKQPPLTVSFAYPYDKEGPTFVEGFYSTEFREPRPGVGERVSKVIGFHLLIFIGVENRCAWP
jgi:hypothetical protein